MKFSKIESGKLTVYPERFAVIELLQEISELFINHSFKKNKKPIKFVKQFPSEAIPLYISTDKIKLKQIFINLLGNAYKFTDSGTIEFGFTLDEKRHPQFYVSDTGIGIAKDKQLFIFERFSQIASVKYGCTGLELPIVKGLLNVLGGDIRVDSEPGKGTTFYFTVNIDQVSDSAIPVSG